MVTTGVPPGRFNRLFIKLHLTKAFSNSKRKYLNFCTYSVYVRLNPHLQFAQLLLEFPLLNLSGGGPLQQPKGVVNIHTACVIDI
jgi:hypothetical protein